MKPGKRRLLLLLLGSAATLLVLIVAAYLYVTSAAGNARLQRLAVDSFNGSLAGSLEVTSAQYRGNRIVLMGLVLRDPDNRVVAKIERVEVVVSLLDLARSQLKLEEAKIDGVTLYLRSDVRGLNLVRSFAPRSSAKPGKGQPSSSTFSFGVQHFQIASGSVEYQEAEPSLRVRFDDLFAEGGGHFTSIQDAAASIQLTAEMAEPSKGIAKAQIDFLSSKQSANAKLQLTLPGVEVDATGKSVSGGQELALKTFRMEPEIVRAFLPSYPLQTSVAVIGSISRANDVLGTDLQISSGATRVSLQTQFGLMATAAQKAVVKIQHLNASELIRVPITDLDGLLRIEGTGNSLNTFQGAARLELSRFAIRNSAFGPIRAELNAKRGIFTLLNLSAQGPGIEFTAQGKGTTERGEIQGRARITALTHTIKAIGVLLRSDLDIDGSGELNVVAKGEWTRPTLEVKADFQKFRYGSIGANGVHLDSHVPNARHPWESTATLSINELSFQGKSFKNVLATLTTRPRAFEVQLSAKGLSSISAFASGAIDPHASRVKFDVFRLEFPEATWQLIAPVNVFFDSDNLILQPMELRADRQAIRVDLEIRKRLLKGSMAIRELDLSRLPKTIVDPELSLGGVLNASVTLGGTLSAPELKTNSSLDHGQIEAFTDISARLDATYQHSRATGAIQISLQSVKLESDFDFPLLALNEGVSEPISIRLAVRQLELSDFIRALKRNVPLSGIASLKLAVSGKSDSPKVQLNLEGHKLVYRNLPMADGQVEVTTTNDGKLGFIGRVSSERSQAEFAANTDYTIRQLLRRPPSQSDVLHDPVSATFSVTKLDLSLLTTLGLWSQTIPGAISSRGKLGGNLSRPTGAVTGQIEGIRIGAFPETNLVINIHTDGKEIVAEIEGQAGNQPLGNATARIRSSVAELVQNFSKVPVEVTSKAAGLKLAWFRAAEPDEPPSKLNAIEGQGTASLDLRGSLENPSVNLSARIDNLGVASMPSGRVDLTAKYENRNLDVDAALLSNAGSMNVTGRSNVDLSLSSLKNGIAFSNVPIVADLRAQSFDLSTLRGIVPAIQLIGGTLSANGKFNGTIARPKFQGDLEWTNGLLTIEGYGRYQKIHLAISATEERIQLKELYAASTSGNVTSSGEAVRVNEQFTFKGQTKANDFPLVIDNQLLAVVSLNGRWSGTASAKLINVENLQLSDAHINLPQVERKNLQTLELPSDVSLVARGKPVESKKATIRALASADAAVSKGAQGLPLWATIDAPRNIWVKSSDIDAELGLSDGFRVELTDKLSLSGTIRVLRGRVELYGRRFELDKKSTVEFAGPPAMPSVNATGIYKNEREQVTVYVNVQGTGSDINIKATSEPPLSETEIYTLLATGRSTLKRGTGSTITGEQVASALGAYLITEMNKVFSKKLPLDVISLESGTTESGSTGLKVEAGKYLSDRFYLGGAARFGADPTRYENSYAARLEYQLSRRWGLETELGDARQTGDLVWSKDF